MRNLFKKSLTLCLVAILAFSCFAGIVSAENPFTATIAVVDQTITPGTTSVDVVLNITSSQIGINEALIEVSSDIGTINSKATLDEATAAIASIELPEGSTNYGSFYLSAKNDISGETTVLGSIATASITVTFTVDENKAVGTYPINIKVYGVRAASGNEDVISFNYDTANVTVAEPHVHEYTYTPNGDKTHNGTCACNEAPITNEACVDGDDEDTLCDKCNFDLAEEEVCVHENATSVVTTKPTKNTEGVRTFTCSNCSETWTEVIPVATLKTVSDGDMYKIGHNLDLQSQILVGYQFRKTMIDASVDSYAFFEKDCYDENGNVTGTVDYSYSVESFVPHPTNENRYMLQFDGATAKEMTSEIRADFYFELKDGSYVYLTDTYTVATFATTAFDVYGDEFNTLLMDMLNYGTAAQNFFGYNIANPANKSFDMFDNYADCASTTIPEIIPYSSKTENAGTNYKIALSRQLNLESAIAVAAAIRNTDKTAYSGDLSLLTAKCVYTTLLGEEETVYITDFMEVGGMYYVNFNKFAARQLNSKVTIEIYEGETLVSDTVSYSIGSYYNALKSYDDTNNEKILAEKLVKYSAAAQAYFG